jgi:hypothetical protein
MMTNNKIKTLTYRKRPPQKLSSKISKSSRSWEREASALSIKS